MNRMRTRLTSVVLISVLACAAVWAQATAQINGTVKDRSGAVLPGVEITATQTATGISAARSLMKLDRSCCRTW